MLTELELGPEAVTSVIYNEIITYYGPWGDNPVYIGLSIYQTTTSEYTYFSVSCTPVEIVFEPQTSRENPQT